jgi:CRP-like cAMP-binding protein
MDAAQNRLLAQLPGEELERVKSVLEHVGTPFRATIFGQDQPIEHVYFPYEGVLSLVRVPDNSDDLTIELATVGSEGMAGLPLALGSRTMSAMCFCQIAGRAGRIPADRFLEILAVSPVLHGVLLRYTQALFTQVAQNAACNRTHPVEERCARWLLQTQDRVHADHFSLTQEFLGQMLGVRRPSVSVAAGMLQKAGLIRYSRGLVVVVDRKGLEKASCSCYAAIRAEYERLVGAAG